MPETPWGKRIREELSARDWATAQLALLSGVPESTISRILSGATKSTGMEIAVKLANALGLSLDELAGQPRARSAGPRGAAVGPVVLVPLVDVTLAAGQSSFSETGDTVAVDLELARSGHLIASKVSGDCMEPEILTGDIVIVDIADKEPKPGQIVAALLNDGSMVVKRYTRERGYPHLIDNQGLDYPISGAQVQGVVVSVVRRFR